MSKPSEEVLFHARCELEAMLAENRERERRGLSPAYGESAFLTLAENTRGEFRKAMEHDTK